MPGRYQRSLIAGLEAGLAAGLSYWLASHLLTDPPVYATVAAVAVTGAGHDRRMTRVKSMLAGMTVAIIVSEVGIRVLEPGPVSIALLTCFSILVARIALHDLLAVTYAGFNAAVLAALGGEGWLPTRAIEAVIGSVTAYALVYLVFPPRPVGHIKGRIKDQVGIAVGAMDEMAQALESDVDLTPARRRAESIERKVDGLSETFDFSREVSRFSPWRLRDRRVVERLSSDARRLQDVLEQVATLVRVASRLAEARVCNESHLADALELQSKAIRMLVESIPLRSDDSLEELSGLVELADRATACARRPCPDDRGTHTTTVEVVVMLSEDLRRTLDRRNDDSAGSIGAPRSDRSASTSGKDGPRA